MERFLGNYGNLQTKTAYSFALARYFEWLRESKGVRLTPDELLTDNFRCQANADPTDIKTRKRHTLWLDEYVNSLLLERGLSDSKRNVTAAAVQQFYLKSDSALFGSLSLNGQAEAPALVASDIRKVLGALPLKIQLPLLCVWQSSMEVKRVLSIRLGKVKAITARTRLSNATSPDKKSL